MTWGVWPIFRSSSSTASTRPGRTRSTRSLNRPATSWANFLRDSSSSARTASSVRTTHTRRCSFTGNRGDEWRSVITGVLLRLAGVGSAVRPDLRLRPLPQGVDLAAHFALVDLILQLAANVGLQLFV